MLQHNGLPQEPIPPIILVSSLTPICLNSILVLYFAAKSSASSLKSTLSSARNLKINIPEEMQVIGFQNTKYAELSRPTLTCINTPIYELGEAAMDLLTELMEESLPEDKSINQLIDFNVIWRNSTK